MSYVIVGVIMLGLACFGWGYSKLKRAERELTKASKAKQALEAKVKQQAVEIEQKNAEVKNAQIYRTHRENVQRASASDVDEQLQQHNYFRNDGNHGVHGVQSDLSKPCGHGGDEASNSCSQSDL